MVHFSLLTEAWIPVLRADGSRACIRPAEITSGLAGNPVVAPAWGRADLDAATRELWIGLLATACGARAGQDEWEAWFRDPPSPEELDAAFAPLGPALVLDGEGPRFGQDREDFAGESVAVSQLLIEAPGGNTVRRNLDHFIRRGGVATLSRAGAAIALFTLQTYAPAGGAGHRVSLRGGGPLTTLLVPGPLRGEALDAPTPLWRTLWLATPPAAAAPIERVFPWLAPTRTSEKARATAPGDVDPLQAFWGMPRRIRLAFEANPEGRPCDLTGRVDEVVVRAYRTRPHGASYVGFVHPLSPHYRAKPSDPAWLPLHGQPGRVGYRHWVGIVVDDAAGDRTLRRAAEAVTRGRDRLADLRGPAQARARLLAAGYDMDNMKAREFIESEMPLHLTAGDRFSAYDRVIRRMIAAAGQAEYLVRVQVRSALFVKRTQVDDGYQKAPKDGGALDLARARFWQRTEAAFGAALARLSDDLGTAEDTMPVESAAAEAWLKGSKEFKGLQRTARDLFDELVSLDDLDALDERSARARIEARSDLHQSLRGHGKLGADLFKALDLAPPESARKRKEPA